MIYQSQLVLEDIKIGDLFKAASLSEECLYPTHYWDSPVGKEFEFGYDIIGRKSNEIILILDIRPATELFPYRSLKVLLKETTYIVYVRENKNSRREIYWERIR